MRATIRENNLTVTFKELNPDFVWFNEVDRRSSVLNSFYQNLFVSYIKIYK